MKCPNCQTSNPDGAKFCMNCGTPPVETVRATDGGVSDLQAQHQGLDKFTPRELITKFEAARADDARVGERRLTTMSGTKTRSFMGLPPSGKQVSFRGMYIARTANGKIVEHWSEEDGLNLLQQPGVPSL